MGMVASQITSLTIVYSTVYSDADQRKHQSSASLAFVPGEFPAQMASNAENVSIWWRNHETFGHIALGWINIIPCCAPIYPSTLGKGGNFSNLNIGIAQAVKPLFIKDITHPILCDTRSQCISSSGSGLILREYSGLISWCHCTYKTNILATFLCEL